MVNQFLLMFHQGHNFLNIFIIEIKNEFRAVFFFDNMLFIACFIRRFKRLKREHFSDSVRPNAVNLSLKMDLMRLTLASSIGVFGSPFFDAPVTVIPLINNWIKIKHSMYGLTPGILPLSDSKSFS